VTRCTCHDVLIVKDLNRWFKEKWVDVSRKDKDGKHPPCGRSKANTSSKGYPKCRPSVKVSDKTPKTSGSMSEGEKQAATKRKRAKKQGVGGKPTIVKSVLVAKSLRQTELGEFHPDFPSSHGPVVYLHGTNSEDVNSMLRQGMIANRGHYAGNFVTTNPKSAVSYSRTHWGESDNNGIIKPGMVGVRLGAGTPRPYFGYENDDESRYFPQHWLFPRDIPPQFLVNMNQSLKDYRAQNGSHNTEAIDPRALPEFYVDGQPPEFPEGLSGFDRAAWEAKWGGQN
jgi:hypothetical protein